jgi:hypothetical protein
MPIEKPVNTKTPRLLTLLLCLVATSIAWAEPDALFTEATRLLLQEHPFYAYSLRTAGSEEVVLEKFDPSLETGVQWQLVTVNDAVPDADRLEQYRERKRREREANPHKKFAEVVDLSSLHRVRENGTEVHYEFQPRLFDNKPELNDKFVGKIIITKADQRLQQLEYRNTETIKPAAVVSLEKLYTQVNFMTLADGQSVAKTISIHSQGTAFVFKKFDEEVMQEYSDYRRTIPEIPVEVPDTGIETNSGNQDKLGSVVTRER